MDRYIEYVANHVLVCLGYERAYPFATNPVRKFVTSAYNVLIRPITVSLDGSSLSKHHKHRHAAEC